MATSTVQIPTLPALSPNVDPSVRRAFDMLKVFFAAAQAQGGFGSTTIKQTVINESGGSGGSGSSGTSIINPPGPPGISGLAATGAFAAIILNWTDPSYSQYGYVEIWRATSNNLGSAVYVGASFSTIFCDIPPTASTAVTYYYWARVVSYTGVTGPWSGTDGVSASTSSNPTYVLQSLTNQITTSQLAAALNTRINLIDNSGTGLVTQVSDINGQYTIKIDNNGHITGIGLVGGSQSGSVEILCTDFSIVNNANPSQLIVPFVVGNIGGVSGVGITGALLVDGTITANSIAAQTISGDKLAVSNLIAHSAQIENGVIDTAHFNTADALYEISVGTPGSLNGVVIADGSINANNVIQAGTLDATILEISGIDDTNMVINAVTQRFYASGETSAGGGDTSETLVTSSTINMSANDPVAVGADAVIQVVVDVQGGQPGDTVTLSRQLGSSFNQTLRSVQGIPGWFQYNYNDPGNSIFTTAQASWNFTFVDFLNTGVMTTPIIKYNYPDSYGYGLPVEGGGIGAGSSFIPEIAFQPGQVGLIVSRTGSGASDNMVIQIYDALNGGNLIAQNTNAIPISTLPTNKKYMTFPLSLVGSYAQENPPYMFNAGLTYYCRITRDGSQNTSCYPKIWGWNSDLISGTGFITESGGTWTQSTHDIRFDLFANITGTESWTYTVTTTPTDPVNRPGENGYLNGEIITWAMTVVAIKR